MYRHPPQIFGFRSSVLVCLSLTDTSYIHLIIFTSALSLYLSALNMAHVWLPSCSNKLLIQYCLAIGGRGVMHVRRQSKSQTTEKSGTINVVTFAAANLLCTNQTWGRANEVSDFPREVSDNWGHAILSWAIPSNGQAPGRETPFSGDD